MSEPGKREAIDTAQGLTASLDNVGAELSRLNAYGRRNRHLIWVTIISLAVNVALTVVVAIFAVQAHDANTTAAANHTANIVACRSGNITRAGELQLWDRLYAASVKGHETAKQRKANAALIAYIRHLFAPRACMKIYRVR